MIHCGPVGCGLVSRSGVAEHILQNPWNTCFLLFSFCLCREHYKEHLGNTFPYYFTTIRAFGYSIGSGSASQCYWSVQPDLIWAQHPSSKQQGPTASSLTTRSDIKVIHHHYGSLDSLPPDTLSITTNLCSARGGVWSAVWLCVSRCVDQ